MFPLTEETPIQIEVLNANDSPISRAAATLHYLDGERAACTIGTPVPIAGLYWGARVRFRLDGDPHYYEIVGSVVAHKTVESTDEDQVTGSQEILLRLFECRIGSQRRQSSRLAARFAVRYRCLETSQVETDSLSDADWYCGWCVDIGGGGMRLHTSEPLDPPQRVLLHFVLPTSTEAEATPQTIFCLQGRVLRRKTLGRQAGSIEMAIKFENLSVQDSQALLACLV